LATVLAATGLPGPAAAAPADHCPDPDNPFQVCVHDDLEVPGDPGDPDPDDSTDPADNDVDDNGYDDGCYWVPFAEPLQSDPSFRDQLHPGIPDDYVIEYYACNGGMVGSITNSTRARPPDEPADSAPAATAIPQAVLGEWARARASEILEQPEPVVTPAEAGQSVVGMPTFVAIGNWQDEILFDDIRVCDPAFPALCVGLTATLTMTFEPGEPGAPPLLCTPPGTYFDDDPAAPAPVTQAQPPACAYTYTRRTTAGTGPWVAEVRVEWDVAWYSTNPLAPASGALEPITRSATFLRTVDEVQGVVTEIGPATR
jgi:hypothetical protein